MTRWFSVDLRGWVVPILLVAAAEIGARVSHLQSDSLASPSAIVAAFVESLGDGGLAVATKDTVSCALSGLGIGFGLGLVLGTLMGMFRIFDRLMEVTVETVRPIPSVALIPVALLVFGFGYRMELAIIAFATVWPTLILSRAAVANVEPRLFEVARVLQLGPLARATKIVLPAALPRLFVALRLALGVALIVAVTVEISANTIGLGHGMMEAQQSLHPDLMLAFLVWIGLLGWALNGLMLWVQRRLFGSYGGGRPA